MPSPNKATLSKVKRRFLSQRIAPTTKPDLRPSTVIIQEILEAQPLLTSTGAFAARSATAPHGLASRREWVRREWSGRAPVASALSSTAARSTGMLRVLVDTLAASRAERMRGSNGFFKLTSLQ